MTGNIGPAWLVCLVGAWFLQALWNVLNLRRFQASVASRRRPVNFTDRSRPGTVIIVPVKGYDRRLADHVRALAAQDFPAYRVIFVVASQQDPAFPFLHRFSQEFPSGAGLKGVDVRVAGPASTSGQKVHNLLAGLEGLEPSDEVVVFADADGVPQTHWLLAMVKGAMRENYGAATGYRWMIPADDGLATRLACVINGSIATLMGQAAWNYAWGGATAIRRDVLEECRVAEHWRGALSDDYQLSRALHTAGRRIFFQPYGMLLSPVSYTWGGLWAFARRQYQITRLYAPHLWLAAVLLPGLCVVGWVACLGGLAAGRWWVAAPIAAVVLMDLVRAHLRYRAAGLLFTEGAVRGLKPVMWLDGLGAGLCQALHLAMAVSGGVGRRIRWAGITYLVRSHQDVRIVADDGKEPRQYTGGIEDKTGMITQPEIKLDIKLVPGMVVEVTQQIPQRDGVWTTSLRGTVVRFTREQTGAWYAHSKGDHLWLERLVLRTDEGETVDLILDQYTHVSKG